MADLERRTGLAVPSMVVMGTAALVAWLGEVAHNLLSLPIEATFGVETVGPGIFTLLLVVAYARAPRNRAVQGGLLLWGILNLVGGGIVSVLPLPIFPFMPDQTLGHYGAHVIYSLAQVPLIWVALRALREPAQA